MTVVEQAIENGSGNDRVPQYLAPLTEAFVLFDVRMMLPRSYRAEMSANRAVVADDRKARHRINR